MADVTDFKGVGRARIQWGKWVLIGLGMLISLMLLVIPLVAIFTVLCLKV